MKYEQGRQGTCKRDTEVPSCCNHCGKAVRFTYPECVSVALVIQHAVRMRLFILSYVACLAVAHFSILSLKRDHLRGEKSYG